MQNILVVEDSAALAATYRNWLAESGYKACVRDSLGESSLAMAADSYAAILLDVRLPDGDGISFLSALRARGECIPVIVMTTESSEETAMRAMRAGANDFLAKPFTAERLRVTLRNILEQSALKSIISHYGPPQRDRFCGFIGRSPAMQAVYRVIENAAESRAPVFITGESGTGKEIAARAIHEVSRRKGRFEALNCAAIPATLIESEMFGHVKGAFTGATASSAGAAHRADGGTLFLDELAEMPVELQSKLLRFTQTGAFRPVGGQREDTTNVRFVCATNRDPLNAVRAGSLREDLYYRLNVIPLHLPPLHARGEDILLIALHMLEKAAREEGKCFTAIADNAQDLLLRAPWPGNVRQLENAVRRAVVLHDGENLTADMIRMDEAGNRHAPQPQQPAPPSPGAIMPLKELERRAIEEALHLCGGNISEAARRLEINPSTIHRKLDKWREVS